MTTAALMKTKWLLLRLAFVQSPLCFYLSKVKPDVFFYIKNTQSLYDFAAELMMCHKTIIARI